MEVTPGAHQTEEKTLNSEKRYNAGRADIAGRKKNKDANEKP